MVALTRDFHVFASRVTADFSAVFFSIGHITQTWYVRAFVGPLIRHFDPFPFVVISTNCIRIAKPDLAASTGFQGFGHRGRTQMRCRVSRGG